MPPPSPTPETHPRRTQSRVPGSGSYSGAASIDIHWTDGTTHDTVDAVTAHFADGDFDGMTDSMSHHSTLLACLDGSVRDVRFG